MTTTSSKYQHQAKFQISNNNKNNNIDNNDTENFQHHAQK